MIVETGFNLSNLGSAALGAVITLITSLVVFLTGILKNSGFQDTLMKHFAKSLNKDVIDKSDIDTHDIFIKLEGLIHHSYFVKDFANINKAKLFVKYTEIVASAYKNNLILLLQNDLKTYNEQSLKIKVHEILISIYKEIDDNFYIHLKSINNDLKKLNIVNNSVKNWRQDIKVIIESNVMSVASSGKYVSTEYKLDKIFNVLSLGFDIILKNGADSFNKLNGELDDFIKDGN